LRLAFLTSTPQSVAAGSGTFVAIRTLKNALESLGVNVELFTPRRAWPSLTFTRLRFNSELLRVDWSRFDCVVGFDLDGYRIAGRTGVRHVASLKGVIADEMRFERGLVRTLMAVQERCERQHVSRADRVLATSRYAAQQIARFYRAAQEPIVVPDLIDLSHWRVERRPACGFVVLAVCHLYRRKRIELLLEASQMLRGRIPGLQVRIVGTGPMERSPLPGVTWLGQVSFEQLQAEYGSADVFCLPSVQEGFGIVFLEAMAAGVPIVAARAAAVPEVVPQGVLVEPESAEALAEAIERLHGDAAERVRLRGVGLERVRQYDAPRVAAQFLAALGVG
jgi:glycosyltransferase involved in cell wall biosynthesis